jgi:hypothetical protein
VRTQSSGAWPIWLVAGVGAAIVASSVIAAGEHWSAGDPAATMRRVAVATAVTFIALGLIAVVVVPRLIASRTRKAFASRNSTAVTALFADAREDSGFVSALQSLLPSILLVSPAEIVLVGPMGSRTVVHWSEVKRIWLSDESEDGVIREPILHLRWIGGSVRMRLLNPRVGGTLTPSAGYTEGLLRSLHQMSHASKQS